MIRSITMNAMPMQQDPDQAEAGGLGQALAESARRRVQIADGHDDPDADSPAAVIRPASRLRWSHEDLAEVARGRAGRSR